VSEDDGKAAGSVPDDPEHLNKLIAAVARRERGAFEQVFAELTSPVYRLALSVLRDPAQAEEVAQEVLTEIWRTITIRGGQVTEHRLSAPLGARHHAHPHHGDTHTHGDHTHHHRDVVGPTSGG
jgi:hypothetical protein